MMAGSGRQFRVFVSSTFADMHAEREVLQRRVFPRLQRFCQRRGVHFQAVDLRWGVSEEAGLDQRTMPLCLSEIRRCQEMTPRPNFLVLLGQRYGWQPLAYEIPKNEYEQLKPLVTDATAGALLEQWYRLDTNALPDGAYVLQPRTDTPFEAPDVWRRGVEEPLQQALAEATRQLNWPEEQARKYVASATEQEIAEGALRANIDHALCFFRTITSLPEDDSSAQYVDADAAAPTRLEDLKGRLRAHLPGSVVEYETPWRDGVQQADLGQFAAEVYRSLRRAIAEQIAAAEVVDPLDQENRDHTAFGLDRQRGFFGRETTLERVREYLREPGGSPLVLHGPSGCGKSGLMARCLEVAEKTLPDAVRLVRFIGATPQSTDLRSLLTDLCAQLGRAYGDEADIPQDIKELKEDFGRRLGLATAERPVVLLLDALDQLNPTDAAHSLNWLPTELPEGVRLIVSVLEREDEAGACWRVARHRIAEDHLLPVPLLQPEEGATILSEWLRYAERTLTDEQRASVLAGFAQSGLPLYLRLAFEEARLWRSYDGVPCGADDRQGLGGDVPGVIRDLLWRLSRGAAHGEVLVRQALGYLGTARNGLADQEMLEILWRDEQVQGDFRRRSPRSPATDSLPPIIWSALYFDLAPYLLQRSADGTALLGFYHRQFAEVVAEEYLSGEQAKPLHRHLAAYFGDQPSWLVAEGAEQRSNLRKASELVTQQVSGECWDEVEGALTDLEFLEAKAEGGQVFDLAMDFTRCNRAFPQDRVWARNLRLLEQALRNDLHFIARHPTTLFQCFWNSAWWYDCPEAANHYDPPEGGWSAAGPPWEGAEPKLCTLLERWRKAKETRQPGFLWLRSLRPPPLALGSAQTMCLQQEGGGILQVAVSSDGQRIAASSGTRLGSGCKHSMVRLWATDTGEELGRLMCEQGMRCLAFSPDGARLAVTLRDGTVGVWNTLRLEPLARERADSWGDAVAVSFSEDGRRLAAVDSCGSVYVWDTRNGRELAVSAGDGPRVRAAFVSTDLQRVAWACADGCVEVRSLPERHKLLSLKCKDTYGLALSPDGCHLAAGGIDKILRVWNARTGQLLLCLEGNDHPISCVAFSGDGNLIASGSSDAVIRTWNARSGRREARLRGHSLPVLSVALTSNGAQLVSGSSDGTVRLWRTDAGVETQTLYGAFGPHNRLVFSPDGRRLGCACRDGTVRVWWTETGLQIARMFGRDPIAFSPDGRLLACASLPDVRMERGEVRLYSADTGQEVVRSTGWHEAPVTRMAFSPDGSRLASGSRNGIVRVWCTGTGQELACLSAGESVVWLAFTQDGRRLASASVKRSSLWDTTDYHLVECAEPARFLDHRPKEAVTTFWRTDCGEDRPVTVTTMAGNAIAWFSARMATVWQHTSAPIWAGIAGSYLALFTLEGTRAGAQQSPDEESAP